MGGNDGSKHWLRTGNSRATEAERCTEAVPVSTSEGDRKKWAQGLWKNVFEVIFCLKGGKQLNEEGHLLTSSEIPPALEHRHVVHSNKGMTRLREQNSQCSILFPFAGRVELFSNLFGDRRRREGLAPDPATLNFAIPLKFSRTFICFHGFSNVHLNLVTKKPCNRRCLFVASQSLIYEIEMLSVSALIRAIKWEKLNKRILCSAHTRRKWNESELFSSPPPLSIHDKTNLKNDFE